MEKSKEPIRLRKRKMASGNTSLYIDIYMDGKRSYEYLANKRRHTAIISFRALSTLLLKKT